MKGFRAASGFALLLYATQAMATPHLRCEVVYAGSSHIVEAAPGTAPYTTKSVDIDGRFRFKAIMLGAGERLDAVKLYAYYQARRQDVLIQEVKYLPPFTYSAESDALTGRQYLYAGPLERELQYGCTLTDTKQ
ncbi:MAG TPA: hypothetical protein VF798_16250 [Burkholderiaceae bacterium]